MRSGYPLLHRPPGGRGVLTDDAMKVIVTYYRSEVAKPIHQRIRERGSAAGGIADIRNDK